MVSTAGLSLEWADDHPVAVPILDCLLELMTSTTDQVTRKYCVIAVGDLDASAVVAWQPSGDDRSTSAQLHAGAGGKHSRCSWI